MFRNFKRGAFRLAPALLLLTTAWASDLPQFSFNELTDSSELVVTGQITRTWADWDSSHKYIWTHYELSVATAQKGNAGSTVDIAEPGGTADGITMSIAGGTGYSVGDKVLVFLSRMPNGYLRTAGFGQGKYVIGTDGNLRGAAHLKTGDATAAAGAIRSLNGMNVGQVKQLVGTRNSTAGGVR